MSVAFVREESAEAAQEASLPARAISAHPNLVTQSGLRGLERALAESQQALKAGQMVEDANERRRALELAGAGRTLLRGTRRERASAAGARDRDGGRVRFPGHDPARRRSPPDVSGRRRGRGGSSWRIDRLCVPACPSAHWKAGR